MKQIFDWLREQISRQSYPDSLSSSGYFCEQVDTENVIDLINEAEAKWEADCCEWKFFKPSNSLYEKHGDFRTGYELEKWSVCPYCGKPINISEVE